MEHSHENSNNLMGSIHKEVLQESKSYTSIKLTGKINEKLIEVTPKSSGKKKKIMDFNKFVIKKIKLNTKHPETRNSWQDKNMKSMKQLLHQSLSLCETGELNKQLLDNIKQTQLSFSKTMTEGNNIKELMERKTFSTDPMVFISINKFVNKVQPITNLNVNHNQLPPRIPQNFKIKKATFNLDQLNERLKHKSRASKIDL